MTRLGEAALLARERAYAPYSGYTVGSAIEDEDGRVHTGCNVENLSFGATMCAERGALSRMVADGGREIRRVAVVTADGGAPCGICLQSLLEFIPNPESVEIELFAGAEPTGNYTLAQLLPRAFVSK
ncbi:MAG: cytidine deaminase, partial [Proteobacteria bacterium]